MQTAMPTLAPSVDIQLFRTVMASLASGVSIVTTLDKEDEPRGLTCFAGPAAKAGGVRGAGRLSDMIWTPCFMRKASAAARASAWESSKPSA